MRIKALLVCLGLVGTGFVSACGKGMTESPIAPSPTVGTSAPSTSATISGRVGSGSGSGFALMSASSTSGTNAGLTVTATGTAATTTTDANGRFQLSVPPGTVELVFNGSGINSRATLGAVAAGDKVDLLVDINGLSSANADLQVLDRVSGSTREIEGRVNAVPPTTASGTFRIGDRLIGTNAETDFFLNGGQGSMQDVIVGTRARVTGPAGTDAMIALDVNVQNDQAPGGSNGGNNGGGNNGGGTGGGGNGGGGTGGGGNGGSETTTVTGPILGLLGSCPALTFFVNATRVNTNANTQFELACNGLLTLVGNATVSGTRNADGSITATTVRR